MINKRVYIIGDIHGCFEELLELEEKIKYDCDKDNRFAFILSCGDLIDKGIHSKKVLEHFIEGKKNNTHLSIMGNHEVMMLQALEAFTYSKLPTIFETYSDVYNSTKSYFPDISLNIFKDTMKNMWLEKGGKETLKSFQIDINEHFKWHLNKEIMEFLISLPIYYEGDNFFVTHGLICNNDIENIKLINNIDKSNFKHIKDSIDRAIWGKKKFNDRIYTKIHVSGHTPNKNVTYIEKMHSLQIDTGCVYGNKLTAFCPEKNTFLYVKSKINYKNKVFK